MYHVPCAAGSQALREYSEDVGDQGQGGLAERLQELQDFL